MSGNHKQLWRRRYSNMHTEWNAGVYGLLTPVDHGPNIIIPTREMKDQAIRMGMALKGHAESAHNGRVDLSCPACSELKAKMDRMNEKSSDHQTPS